MKSIQTVEFLIYLILNNSRLSYDQKDLRIDNELVVLEAIKVLAKDEYEARLKELQEKENKED